MGLDYAEWSYPLTSISVSASVPRGGGTRGQRGRAWKMMVGGGMNTAAMESCKRKLSGRGCAPAEPTDVRIGREIAGKVGNSKKVVIG